MSTFVKKSELKLVNGGYLVTGKDDKPVNHDEFVALQKKAEYIITFAKLAKGKDFKGKEAYSLELLRADTVKAISENKVEYVKQPKTPSRKLSEGLKEEALAFIDYKSQSYAAEKVNDYLQKFNAIKEFEEFGLYFEEGITKLNKIYTVAEITEAVESVIELLN